MAEPYVLLLPLQLMAHLFNRCWRKAFVLAQVCRQFAIMVKRREFWMPGVQREIAARCPQIPLNIREMVDPFFEFPKHVLMRPHKKHWAQWLFWMFPRNQLNRVELNGPTYIDILYTHRSEGSPRLYISIGFGIRKDGGVTTVVYYQNAGVGNAYFECAKTMFPELRYTVHFEGRLVWVDSYIEDMDRDSLAMWRGGVETNGINNATAVPNLEAGHWKEIKK